MTKFSDCIKLLVGSWSDARKRAALAKLDEGEFTEAHELDRQVASAEGDDGTTIAAGRGEEVVGAIIVTFLSVHNNVSCLCWTRQRRRAHRCSIRGPQVFPPTCRQRRRSVRVARLRVLWNIRTSS